MALKKQGMVHTEDISENGNRQRKICINIDIDMGRDINIEIEF